MWISFIVVRIFRWYNSMMENGIYVIREITVSKKSLMSHFQIKCFDYFFLFCLFFRWTAEVCLKFNECKIWSLLEVRILFNCMYNLRQINQKTRRVLYSHRTDASTALDFGWFDAHALFTSLKSSLMRFTASFNVEDSHDALSPTVDCASTTTVRSIIGLQVTATKNARPNEPNMLIHRNQCRMSVRLLEVQAAGCWAINANLSRPIVACRKIVQVVKFRRNGVEATCKTKK